MPFTLKTQLTPSQTYYASIGALLAAGWQSMQIVKGDASDEERARIFEKDNQRVVLYFPGKDNAKARDANKPTEPLHEIILGTLADLKAPYTKNDLVNAKHLFIVCESNTYYTLQVNHFVMAQAELKANGWNVTIEDSIDWSYDLGGLSKELKVGLQAIEGSQLRFATEKRGWQWIVLDDWQCGHYVIAAMDRIARDSAVKIFTIDSKVLDRHQQWFDAGFATSERRFEQVSAASSSQSTSSTSNDDLDDFVAIENPDDFVDLGDEDEKKNSPR